jgi:hypothetical protein
MRALAYRPLRIAAILAFVAFAGCGSGSSRPRGSGYATFSWYVFDVEDYQVTCDEVGAAAVVVTLTDVQTGDVYTQPAVSCAALGMSTDTVPAGSYYVGFDLYGDPSLYGNNSTALDSFDIVDDYGNLATFRILAGANDFSASYAEFIIRSLHVAWNFASGPPASVCASLGVRYIDLDFSTAASPDTAVTTRFDCTAGAGLSFPYPYGPSEVAWRLYLVNAAGVPGESIGGSASLPPLTAAPTDVSLGTALFPY